MSTSEPGERQSGTESPASQPGNSEPVESPADDGAASSETPRDDETGPAEGLSEDEIFHLLQTQRRRLVLRYLRDREGSVVMRDVAEQVAAWEHDTTTQALTSKERQRVYIPLYQTHLPKLDEAGVIEYDQGRGVIEPTDRIDRLYDVLDLKRGPEATEEPEETDVDDEAEADSDRAVRDSTAYYGGASVLSMGLVTAAWVGVVAIPGVALATIVVGLFTLLTFGVPR